jgi:hypothetical protein
MTNRVWPFVFSFLIVAAAALWMLYDGRDLICPCGTIKLWHADPASPESSQHVADWYTLSHVIHGFLFYAFLWLVVRRLPLAWRFAIATAIEAAWEVFENSEIIIERYRAVTISVDYNGDSILNSVADIVAMWIGFALARVLPVWASVALVIGFEVLAAIVIRDGLLLNIIMLVYPIDQILEWQAGLAQVQP